MPQTCPFNLFTLLLPVQSIREKLPDIDDNVPALLKVDFVCSQCRKKENIISACLMIALFDCLNLSITHLPYDKNIAIPSNKLLQ